MKWQVNSRFKYNHQTSEEAVAESMEANEYEFYEDGSIA